MFYNCTSLINLSPNFNLPQGIILAGIQFADGMFYGCTELKSLPNNFNFPKSINGVRIGNYFASNMFSNCTKLGSLPDNFNLPKDVISVGKFFASNMFYNCKSLKISTDFRFPNINNKIAGYGSFLNTLNLGSDSTTRQSVKAETIINKNDTPIYPMSTFGPNTSTLVWSDINSIDENWGGNLNAETTINLNLNYTGSANPLKMSIHRNYTLTPSTEPKRDGYIFNGFTKTKDGDDFLFDSSGTPNPNFTSNNVVYTEKGIWLYTGYELTVYAKWTKNPTIDKLTTTVTGSTVNVSWTTTGTFQSFEITLTNNVNSAFHEKTVNANTKKLTILGTYAGTYTVKIVGKHTKGTAIKTVSLKVALKPAKNPVQFSDIQNLPVAYQTAIEWMGKYAITTGDGKGNYLPNDSITREQMAIFLWKLAGQPPQTRPDVPLSDISSLGAVSQTAIRWLASTRITTGDGKGHYMPKDNVTREQMALFMWKLAGTNPKAGGNSMNFNDIWELGKVSQQAINWIASYSITVGDGDEGDYLPKDNVTRGQMALFMSKLGNTIRNY
jgi:hypothetical protein